VVQDEEEIGRTSNRFEEGEEEDVDEEEEDDAGEVKGGVKIACILLLTDGLASPC
jgi:hypothetical protein